MRGRAVADVDLAVVGIVWQVSMPAVLTEVAAAIVDLLADGRARDEDQLIVALEARGLDLGVDPEGAVADVWSQTIYRWWSQSRTGMCCYRRCCVVARSPTG